MNQGAISRNTRKVIRSDKSPEECVSLVNRKLFWLFIGPDNLSCASRNGSQHGTQFFRLPCTWCKVFQMCQECEVNFFSLVLFLVCLVTTLHKITHSHSCRQVLSGIFPSHFKNTECYETILVLLKNQDQEIGNHTRNLLFSL